MKARRLSGLRLILTGTLPAFCCALFAAAPARATFYDITTNSMQVAPGSPCTFPEAIVAITTQASFNGCAAGELTNTIDLKAATYTATIPFNLVGSVVIQGRGVGQTIIRANLSQASELFRVAPNLESRTDVVFQDLTIDKASTQSAFQVSGVYAVAVSEEHVLGVDFLRTRIAGHTWGGIYSDGAEIFVEDSTITGNYSPAAGGGIRVANNGDIFNGGARGQTVILSSTINDNTSDVGGGGVYHGGMGISRMDDTTVSGNDTSGSGGGLWLNATDDYFIMGGNTIAFNTALVSGGGVYSPTEKNYFIASIVANNTAPAMPDWDGITADSQRALIGNSWGFFPNGEADNIKDEDPILDSTLRDLGGPFHTKVHKLLPGSPAIDHFTPGSGQTFDQRHFLRCLEADGTVAEETCDIGAYEHDPGFFEMEFLTVAAKSSDSHVSVTDTGYSTTVGRNLQSNETGDFVTYSVPVFQSGTYNVKLKVRKGNNRGRVQLKVSNNSNGPWTNVGTWQELYSQNLSFEELNVSNNASLTAGTRYFRFEVVGKHSSSLGRQLYLDYVKLTKL